jgi:ubiquinone/menaquinone biosynthesis C-methylase UbiE
MWDHLDCKKNEIKSILDVGVGTGDPLKTIIGKVPKTTKVLGIDIDRNYLPCAMKTFE